MSRITRRDLINGTAVSLGAGLLSSKVLGSPDSVFYRQQTEQQYPPALTGMRGSHDGSFEVAHDLAWRGVRPDRYTALEEHYDLIVVGAGLSGLAAAHYWRRLMGADARILLLDNHDDFGGHAKRNEFHHNERMVLSIGGAQNLENPGAYSKVARSLLLDLGIDERFLDAMAAKTPDDFFLGGKFDAQVALSMKTDAGSVTLGGNWVRYFQGGDGYEAALRSTPLTVAEQDQLIAFIGGARDYLDDLSLTQKYEYIQSTSYNQFLSERVGLPPRLIAIFDVTHKIYHGFTGWNVSVAEAIAAGSPGLRALGWLGHLAQSTLSMLTGSLLNVRMFPDGNATIARLLVQRLIPGVAPTMKGVEDVALAHFDYAALDRPKQATRIRLNSTVVGVRESPQGRVDVEYVRLGKPERLSADHCVLACYNGIIPHLCPQLPEAQKAALRYGVKVPFVYANVLLDNGQAFSKLPATLIQCPWDPFPLVSAAPSMTTGGYQPPSSPQDPMAVFMMSSPITDPVGGESLRDQLRVARARLYATPFEVYEQQLREQLQALLGPHGFEHQRDIRAITVNRIPHGYAYAYMALYDPAWEQGQAPHELGRAKFGRISIANSDSEATPYMNAAFDAAWRAVNEQRS